MLYIERQCRRTPEVRINGGSGRAAFGLAGVLVGRYCEPCLGYHPKSFAAQGGGFYHYKEPEMKKLPNEPTFLPFQQDWHQADIIAAVRKKGTTLAALSRAAGLSSSTLANALTRPWAKGEMLISKAIGVPPSIIWPSRYFDPATHELIERPMRKQNKNLE